uniref:Uncharacterized protein n=1 Tax=Glossina brevipalpis TaxID=37001 RepID=A0A1A9WB58_9MUSC
MDKWIKGNNIMSSSNTILVVLITALTTANSARYRFIPDNIKIYRDCVDGQGMGGVSDLVDQNDLNFSFDDEGMHMNGTAVVVWDIEETDRVSVDFELKKYVRGTWTLTPLSLKFVDLCQRMRDITSPVYEYWTKYLITDDGRIPCFGKGVRTLSIVKFHHEPFEVKVEFELFGMNMEGRWNVYNLFQAYDKNNERKSKAICMEVPAYSGLPKIKYL